MIEGPLKIWPFPIVNMFVKPEFSIKDHKVLSGSPNYTGNYEITTDKDSTPWKIELVYEIVMTEEIFDKNGNLINSATVTIPEGKVLELRADVIESFVNDSGGKLVVKQDEPR